MTEVAKLLVGRGARVFPRQELLSLLHFAAKNNNPELIKAYGRQNRSNDPKAYASAYRVLAQTDLADELYAITAPTLVATGDGDVGSNTRMAKLMHERIPGSSLHIFENLRHSILAEAPDRVAALIRGFLL